MIIESTDGSFKYDFVWYLTDDFPSVWSVVWTWLVALLDEDMPHTFTSEDVELFWEKHGSRMLRQWESFRTLTPLSEIDNHFSACIAWSHPGKIVRELRDHVGSYLITHQFFVADS